MLAWIISIVIAFYAGVAFTFIVMGVMRSSGNEEEPASTFAHEAAQLEQA